MRYVCSICGYVYDEGKETVPFSELPDTWVCPLCGAAKTLFKPEQREENKAPAEPVQIDEEDMTQLSAGVLAAVCSNLARGCEKQYKEEESALFQELAQYFTAAAPAVSDADTEHLCALLQEDLEKGYPAVRDRAVSDSDRGTQRICVWGEKVTQILYMLLQRYQKEGTDFLRNTQIWVCSVCGFVYVGDSPPEICPVCKVPDWKFDQM